MGYGHYSAYILDEIQPSNLKYNYFQCVTNKLYNKPDDVIPEHELFETLENIASPLHCLEACAKKNHEMALLSVQDNEYNCFCNFLPSIFPPLPKKWAGKMP